MFDYNWRNPIRIRGFCAETPRAIGAPIAKTFEIPPLMSRRHGGAFNRRPSLPRHEPKRVSESVVGRPIMTRAHRSIALSIASDSQNPARLRSFPQRSRLRSFPCSFWLVSRRHSGALQLASAGIQKGNALTRGRNHLLGEAHSCGSIGLHEPTLGLVRSNARRALAVPSTCRPAAPR